MVGIMAAIAIQLSIRHIAPFIAAGIVFYDGLNRLLEPLYAPIRRVLPPMGGLDLAPLVALIAVYALRIILINNAPAFA